MNTPLVKGISVQRQLNNTTTHIIRAILPIVYASDIFGKTMMLAIPKKPLIIDRAIKVSIDCS